MSIPDWDAFPLALLWLGCLDKHRILQYLVQYLYRKQSADRYSKIFFLLPFPTVCVLGYLPPLSNYQIYETHHARNFPSGAKHLLERPSISTGSNDSVACVPKTATEISLGFHAARASVLKWNASMRYWHALGRKTTFCSALIFWEFQEVHIKYIYIYVYIYIYICIYT